MEQRPLRLGDIVDDYCPRERRVTNHAIVAIIEDAIRQTRCTTCDAEHVYKHAKEPRRRKGDLAEGLDDRALADAGNGQLVAARPPGEEAPQSTASSDDPGEAASAADSSETAEPEPPHDPAQDLWPGHRQLIRASLPRTENEPPTPRPIPEFTMYQRQQRPRGGGFGFRQSSGWNGHGNGHGGGQSHGNGNGNGNGNVDGNTRGPSGRPGRSGRHRNKHKRPR